MTDITITPGEIRRKRPREFYQVGEVFIPKGARMTRTRDESIWGNCVDRNSRPRTVFCRRAVRKNGKPLGPWLYNLNNYSYREETP